MPLSPDTIALIRQRYADSVAIAQIAAEVKLSNELIYKCIDGTPPGADPLPPLPRRLNKIPQGRRTADVGRRALVARLWRSARKQVREVEERLAGAGEPSPARERDTRMLAVLVKTLRDLTALDQAQSDPTARKDPPPADDDAVPRDLDELRRELARRVDLLRQRGTAAGPDGGAPA